MRVFNLAQLYGFKYDFHLSFKLDPTGQWALGDGTHFCARDDARGKNFCFYWFYHLKQTRGGALAWSYADGAPDSPQNQEMREDVAISASSVTGAALRFASRDASRPLTQILDKFNSLIQQRRAHLVVSKSNNQVVNLEEFS